MIKKKNIDSYSLPRTRKIIKHGNSLAFTIPKQYVGDLNLKKGGELAICMNKEASVLLLIKRPFKVEHSEYDMNFKLTLPKKFVEKLIKKKN